MGNKIDKEAFYQKLKELNPNSNFQVISYVGLREKAIVKCLNCGKETERIAERFFTNLNICENCKEFTSMYEKASFLLKNYDLKIEKWTTERPRYAEVFCAKCGKIFLRTYTSLISYPNNCPNCNTRFHKQALSLSQAKDKVKLFSDGEYDVIEYSSYHTKAKFQHCNCGFIWNEDFSSFFCSRGCPQCYRNKSLGEQKIEEWLKRHNITFISQYGLNPPYRRYKFDFFLPKYNLAIEYQGEQHYKDKSSIWEDLKTIQARDMLKEKYCNEHNIELIKISYLDYENIPIILASRFND